MSQFSDQTIQLEYANNRWNDTKTLKFIILWGTVVHNILLLVEIILYVERIDPLSICTLTLLWTLTVFLLLFLYFVRTLNKVKLTIWWLAITILSILLAFSIQLKTLICHYYPNPVLVCVEANRPRLRFYVYYVTLGPIFGLLILENDILYQAVAIFLIWITYTWSSVVLPVPPLGTSLIDSGLVGGAFVAILYVSYVYGNIAKRNFVLTNRLREEVKERQAAEENVREESQKRTNFTSYIFHEMRVPLNAIMLSVNYLEGSENFKACVTEEEKRIVNSLHASLGAIESILTDSLDYEKLSKGFFQLNVKPFDFHKTILSLVAGMEWSWKSNDQEFTLNLDAAIDDSMYLQLGDEMRVRQVVANYLSNAFKYTPPGGHIELTTKEKSRDADTQVIYLEVKDDGIGISREDQEKLFKPFVQIGSNRSAKMQKGTGLGLSISAELIKRMEGTYGVESELGKGSVFWLQIPFKLSRVRKRESQTTTTSGPSVPSSSTQVPTPPPSGENLSILLVEDNPLMLSIMSKMFIREGYATDLAHDGKEAVEMVEARQKSDMKMYDVIFMDELMPNMTGVEAIHILREQGYQFPIIALTGDTQAEKKDELMRAGATQVLYKPATWAVLKKTLQILPRRNDED